MPLPPSVTGEFSLQRDSNVGRVSLLWRHRCAVVCGGVLAVTCQSWAGGMRSHDSAGWIRGLIGWGLLQIITLLICSLDTWLKAWNQAGLCMPQTKILSDFYALPIIHKILFSNILLPLTCRTQALYVLYVQIPICPTSISTKGNSILPVDCLYWSGNVEEINLDGSAKLFCLW